MAEKVTSSLIGVQLQDIGVMSGDVVFLAADLRRVGFFCKDRSVTLSTLVGVLLDAVGRNGTIVIPAYTNSFSRFNRNSACIFRSDVESTSGSLSNAILKDPRSVRSMHPTNSCIAIGPQAEFILSGHDERAKSYLPYHRVISLGGKNLMLGCFADRALAPMALHAAQEELGITGRNWRAGLTQSFYECVDGDIKLFTRMDCGGCTAFGYKTIGHHFIKNAIEVGPIGKGLSACIDCRKSLEIFRDIYINNPFFLKCDDKRCRDCWGSPIFHHPAFWAKEIMSAVSRRVQAGFGGLSIG